MTTRLVSGMAGERLRAIMGRRWRAIMTPSAIRQYRPQGAASRRQFLNPTEPSAINANPRRFRFISEYLPWFSRVAVPPRDYEPQRNPRSQPCYARPICWALVAGPDERR